VSWCRHSGDTIARDLACREIRASPIVQHAARSCTGAGIRIGINHVAPSLREPRSTYVYWRLFIRRGGRAVECGGLENR
jgi:hypothetical protein